MNIMKRNQDWGGLTGRDFSHAFSDLYNRFFDGDFFSTDLAETGWSPRVDLFEKDGKVIVKADIPGIDEKKLDVQLRNGVLTISGNKEETVEKKERNIHRIERSYGSFIRSILLPEGIDQEAVNADYQKGVLTITIPKAKEAQTEKISVKVA
jgi:HSP20 family protein